MSACCCIGTRPARGRSDPHLVKVHKPEQSTAQPSTPPHADDVLLGTQMQVKRMQKIIDLQQGLLERLMQGNIADDVRTEYIAKINDLEAGYSEATASLEAQTPKASPAKRMKVKELWWEYALCQSSSINLD